MPLPIYLAMTAAEFRKNPKISARIGWMACHFSPYGTGLSNFPTQLPEGSLLILNDRTPVCGHDPALIAEQLLSLTGQFRCSRVLLDLQRPGNEETTKIVRVILQALPCPVAVSEAYGASFSCPIFLPPIPILQAPAQYLSPWQGREIWLEADLRQTNYLITESGAVSEPYRRMDETVVHHDQALCCRYCMADTPEGLRFSIQNDPQLFHPSVEALGVTCMIGLYQELGCSDQ